MWQAITALNSETLIKSGVNDTLDMARIMPGVRRGSRQLGASPVAEGVDGG